jgi:hypothetical protein
MKLTYNSLNYAQSKLGKSRLFKQAAEQDNKVCCHQPCLKPGYRWERNSYTIE